VEPPGEAMMVEVSNTITWWWTSGTTCTSGPPHPPAWRDIHTDAAALIYDLRRRLEWPATFPCEHCGVRLQLDRVQAVRAGRDKRISVPLA